jgi:TPR repeat protein
VRWVSIFFDPRLWVRLSAGASVICWVTQAWGGPLEDGKAAYRRGDYTAALGFWGPLAAKGDRTAEAEIGRLYDLGLGVPRTPEMAVAWYQMAASHGNAAAQCNLAVMYWYGKGVRQNWTLARHWLEKSAQQRFGPADSLLGIMYFNGLGVRRDLSTALTWYRRASADFNNGIKYSNDDAQIKR